MTPKLSLGLSVSVVGPRAKLLTMERWPMAMRITVGTADDVDPEQGVALVRDTLPWEIWSAPAVEAVIVTETGHASHFPVETEAPLVENTDFLKALKASIQLNGERLARKHLLDFKFIAHQSVPTDNEGDDRVVSWPGLVQTVSSLAPPTPSALLCTWYFWLPREHVAVENDGVWAPRQGVLVSAVPRSYRGALVDGFSSRQGQVGGFPVHVVDYQGGGATAFCEALDISAVLGHRLDEMDNYWLSIRDSRDDSLLQLGPQLDAALDPSSILGTLSIEQLGQATIVEDDLGQRGPTPSELSLALQSWRAKALAINPQVPFRKAKILAAAAAASQDQAGAARDAYIEQADEFLQSLGTVTVVEGTRLRLSKSRKLAESATERLLASPGTAIRPASPADGIELMIGDESLRLRHIDETHRSAVDDVAAIQLYGRRSSVRSGLDAAPAEGGVPWHALTSARYTLPVVDTLPASFSSERVLGVTATYQDEVLYRELSYAGANLVCVHPLSAAHRESMRDDPLEPFQLAAIGREASTGGSMRALPLRYGDYYEFAAAVVDRAGGMADELTSGSPWAFDAIRIAKLDPPQRDSVCYLRSVPVGDLNVTPQVGSSWPQTPAGVSLRCAEDAAPAERTGPAPAPIFLVPSGKPFKPPAAGPNPPDHYRFVVDAPQADEHTLLRWLMPATTLDDDVRQKAAVDLKERLVRIYEKRDQLLVAPPTHDARDTSVATGEQPPILARDPAIAGIGVRWTYADGTTDTTSIDVSKCPTVIEVRSGASSHANKTTLQFEIPKGQFVCIRMCLLVSTSDLMRFETDVLANHLADEQHWPGFGAFEESLVWAEVASDELPNPDADLLHLQEEELGDVRVSYALRDVPAAERPLHANVIQTRIASERWIWRNLPLPAEDGFAGDAADTRRRLASGPPATLMDPAMRDNDPAVDHFDRLSEIDQGFVQRADILKPYPRETKDRAVLVVDERDGHSQSDYLRYAVRFRSRYAPVLQEPETEWSAKRRIAVPFRGNRSRIKPPKVLAVLPLTQSLDVATVEGNPAGGTPFLVVLDERWFREHGIGERLEARIAHVKPEIPEGEGQMPQQKRFGPLPDHHHAPVAVAGLGEPLNCFGPFGMSLDRGGSQAQANATAFVVYPPTGTPPHYNLFVEFARVLDLPTDPSSRSEYSEAYPMYTLADSASLAFGDSASTVKLVTATDGFRLTGPAQLAPFVGADAEVMGQYRYLLIVGRLVRDGGREVEVFLPEDALWLASEGHTNSLARWIGERSNRVFTAAVVAEVLLNGRFAQQEVHPLAGPQTLRDLMRKLLDDGSGGAPVEDSPGMLRRVSPWFRIQMPS